MPNKIYIQKELDLMAYESLNSYYNNMSGRGEESIFLHKDGIYKYRGPCGKRVIKWFWIKETHNDSRNN